MRLQVSRSQNAISNEDSSKSQFAAENKLYRATKWRTQVFKAHLNAIMSAIIGRNKEVDELKKLVSSPKAEFVAIYGRRRVGKTFLVDEGTTIRMT